uniref:Uncharacterized protein n=1 Tax=Anguilla anguilla TaxID=7936 RepID=A0A0E9QSC8_ANGAN
MMGCSQGSISIAHMRFWKGAVALTADIQRSFHCFLMREDRRYCLCFLCDCNYFESDVTDYTYAFDSVNIQNDVLLLLKLSV